MVALAPLVPMTCPRADAAPRQLSSRQTVLFSRVVPALAFAVFGGLAALAVAGALEPLVTWLGLPSLPWLLLALWLVAAPLTFAVYGDLKHVRLDAQRLYVADGHREIAVPLASIGSITERRWHRLQPITVTFRAPTPLGRAIRFMPPRRLGGFFTPHPVAEELRRAVRAALERTASP